MLLWILFALLSAVALAAVLRPLFAAPAIAADGSPVAAVYKDQIAEIDADHARGLLDPFEAEAARREVARRLLAHAAERPAATAISTWVPAAALAIGIVAPLVAIGTYLLVGAPGVPARPFAGGEQGLADAGVIELVRRVEDRLARHPEDGRGWEVVAPVYFRMQRFDEAAAAYRRATELLGENIDRLAGFAEATVMANNGIVTEPARIAYEKLTIRAPDRVEPKFWLALAKEQDGRHADAAADYRAILGAAPGDAPWRALLVERLAAVDPKATIDVAPTRGPGPGAQDAAAAALLPPEERSRMIGQMVAGLAERLRANTQDPDGWARLVRSYVVLGERGKATDTLAEARRHLAGNTSALSMLHELEKALGLGS